MQKSPLFTTEAAWFTLQCSKYDIMKLFSVACTGVNKNSRVSGSMTRLLGNEGSALSVDTFYADGTMIQG